MGKPNRRYKAFTQRSPFDSSLLNSRDAMAKHQNWSKHGWLRSSSKGHFSGSSASRPRTRGPAQTGSTRWVRFTCDTRRNPGRRIPQAYGFEQVPLGRRHGRSHPAYWGHRGYQRSRSMLVITCLLGRFEPRQRTCRSHHWSIREPQGCWCYCAVRHDETKILTKITKHL